MLRSILQKSPTFRLAHSQNQFRSFASNKNVATVRLYRILFRQLRALPTETPFLLQPPLNPRDYGRARLMNTPESSETGLFQLFARWYEEENDDEDINDWYQDLVGRELAHEDYQHDGDIDTCLWTSQEAVRSAIRTAFRASHATLPTIAQQRFAIMAIQWLQDVEKMIQRSSVSTENGLRVVATSSCIGVASSGSALINETKHRFAYRVRVENLADNDVTVQVLGRTWKIHEDADPNSGFVPDPVIVNAPTTGAVGHLPVLQPGSVFEYMSGCELAASTGKMGGLFHMAVVDAKTPSAMVGDPIDAFSSTEKFELPVQPFPLVADTAKE